MKKLLLLGLVGLTTPLAAQQTVNYELFTEMNGGLLTQAGTSIPIWGYGHISDGEITLPGPILTCMEGDSVVVFMDNPSPESHTIHWHGLDVDQANDGVPSTSFLVPTDSAATYRFRADHSGTYLYHCHVTTTLHLTMGMYGMFLVDRPDGTLFEGGPGRDRDVPKLFSDLELATNFNPPASFPFHDMRPNYFMINGATGDLLYEPEAVTTYTPGEVLALRLGSMAYSRVDVRFPEVLGAQLWMSDGRPVTNPGPIDTLEIYPGERFTVLFTAPSMDATGWNGEIEVDYWSMVDETLERTQPMVFADLTAGVSSATSDQIRAFPNPTSRTLNVDGAPSGSTWTLRDATGRPVMTGRVPEGRLEVDLAGKAAGLYIFSTSNGASLRVLHQP